MADNIVSGEVENAEPTELTSEQRDDASATKYRAQFSKGTSAQVTEEGSAAPVRPEHIPEKFWDAEKGEIRVEDLAKSYAELEKSRSKPAPKTGEEGDEGGENGEGGDPPDPKAAIATEITAHREKMTEKIMAGEAFDDGDYAPFEQIGFSRDDIDAFVAGQQALGQIAEMAVFKEVGGEESYRDMISWAKDGYSKEEIEVYDRDIRSQDATVRLTAARGLAARYERANGTNGKSVTQAGSKAGQEMYRSKAEMVKEMSSPEYKNDSAYRERVAKKVQASYAAGVNLKY